MNRFSINKSITAYFVTMLLAALTMQISSVKAQDIYAAIKVNDKIITNYDIKTRASLFKLQRMGSAAAKKKAEQELIDEALQMSEAKRLGISVAESQVDAAIGSIAQRSKVSIKTFERALAARGVNPKTLRNRIRAALAWREVIQARFRATVNIRQEDIIASLAQDSSKENAKQNKVTEYTLKQIIFLTPKRASKAMINRRKNEANALRKKFISCGSSLDITKSLKDVAVRDLGRKLATELPPQLVKTLDKTQNGRLTQAESGEKGVVMIAVCDKRQVSGTSEAERDIENKLREEEGQLLARSYIRDLRSNATIIHTNGQ